jgi:hypothetical protein
VARLLFHRHTEEELLRFDPSDTASDHGWEFHDASYDEKIKQLAEDAEELGIPKA